MLSRNNYPPQTSLALQGPVRFALHEVTVFGVTRANVPVHRTLASSKPAFARTVLALCSFHSVLDVILSSFCSVIMKSKLHQVKDNVKGKLKFVIKLVYSVKLSLNEEGNVKCL